MAYKIVWSTEAENDFLSIFNYLKENWSLLSAQKFAENTFKRLDKIATTVYYQPRATSKSSIQIIKLDKKNVLFFYNRRRFYGIAKYLSLQKRHYKK